MSQYDPLTLAGIISRLAEEKPDFTVLTIEGAGVRPDETRTYLQLWEQGKTLAAGLRAQGVTPGDMIGTLLANHIELVDLMVASALLGTIFVPIDPRTKGEKLTYMLSAAGCTGIVVADYALQNLRDVRDQLPQLKLIVGLPTDEGQATDDQLQAAGIIPWSKVTGTAASDEGFPGSTAEGPMELIYTSGTTGDPKGIVMTHRRYCENAKLAPMMFGFTAEDKLYTGLSLTHANAQVVTLGSALANSIPCVLSRRFTKSRLWDITRKYGCTNFSLLGGMTTAIYAEPPKPNDTDNPVRVVIAAGMPAAIWNEFKTRFNVELIEWYGAAEGGLTVNPAGVGPVGSIGKAVPILDYRLVDDNDNDVLKDANGERTGEILFRAKDGTPFIVEYYGNPEASAKKCVGGWLHMGDVIREDKDGWLYFLFRKGSGIRRNGDFINASFIEKTIAEIPKVDDVYIYGVPAANGVPGEKDVVATLVPKDGNLENFDVQAVFRQCRENLEANFVPSYIQVLQQIPKTASEKPQDRFLLEAFKNDPTAVHSETL